MNTELVEKFEALLQSTGREGIDKLIKYIRTTDFYTAPASTRFHSSYEGGLLQHSINVYEMLEAKSKTDTWKDIVKDKSTIIIVSLLHDLCKANYYAIEMRNKKNEQGKWEQVPFYTVDDQSPYGHGEKSVMILMEFIKLTAEEKYAIRWHMGFSEPKENYQYLGKAMDKYPLICALHEADLEATHLLEVDKGDED
ncbi:hydrolase [Ruminococcus albus SY3]|uniref:Hydrolase n=1 Tax=Ruminococcus albus SY3 TaxID=1341156 RepID=A0A011WKV2_RUMAL|nr:hypothetical protein [Ruminococcus albus]EXM37655.1 hydrolase [Ruminococcus albus SY3]